MAHYPPAPKRWRHWLFEVKKRFGLSALNYIVTSNHIHRLVHDQGKNEIEQSVRLIAGRTAQEFKQRKGYGKNKLPQNTLD